MSPENSKPEWFQLAEADPMPAKPKSRKRFPLMAIATPLLVVGAGLAYAQTQDSSPASAGTPAQAAANPIAIASTPTAAASTPVTSTPSATSSSTLSSTPASTTVQVSQNFSTPTQVPPIAPTTITKPGLTMPTGGGEDDGQEDSGDDN